MVCTSLQAAADSGWCPVRSPLGQHWRLHGHAEPDRPFVLVPDQRAAPASPGASGSCPLPSPQRSQTPACRWRSFSSPRLADRSLGSATGSSRLPHRRSKQQQHDGGSGGGSGGVLRDDATRTNGAGCSAGLPALSTCGAMPDAQKNHPAAAAAHRWSPAAAFFVPRSCVAAAAGG